MPSIFSYQPFKSLYLLYAFTTTVIIVPIWLIGSLPRSRRPRHSWDLKRVIFVRLLKRFSPITSKIGLLSTINHLALGPPGDDFTGVWVDGVPHLVTAELESWAETASVSPIRIPGYWLHKRNSTIPAAASPMPGEKVVYALHGGGYVRLSAHPTDPTANIARGLLKYCDTVHRVFSIEYRLSVGAPNPANPFPAALLDALAGYNYLVNDVGFSPEDIIMEGDSAGGNLAHALTRYLVEHRGIKGIPAPPGALLLLSPWCDLGQSHEGPDRSMTKFLTSDFLQGGERMDYLRTTFVGPHGTGAGELNRYISPASLHPSMQISFKGFPKTFIMAGGAEILLDQIKTLKDRMVKDLGESNVTYFEAKDGVHDYLAFKWHEPERGETLEAIAKWVYAG